MPYTNKEKAKVTRLAWYYRNKETEIVNQRLRSKDRRKRLTTWLRDYKKQLTCSDCGFNFSEFPECCDFHHIDPSEKDFVIRIAVSYSIERALKEISKCVPLCANCHRIRHAKKKLD